MENLTNKFIDIYPSIDLHGEVSDSVPFLVNDFINDNVKLGKKIVVIVHGKGEGILKDKVKEVLKTNKNVIQFQLSADNPGATIVEIKCQ